jgi:branched-chain amino acid aminotransferase
VNSILASREARAANYDEALLLDVDGYVSEASGENIFIVSDGVVKTPPLPTILGGITRHAVLQMLRDLGVPTREDRSRVTRSISPTRRSSPAPRPR